MIKRDDETIRHTSAHQWLISNGGDESRKGGEVTQLNCTNECRGEDFGPVRQRPGNVQIGLLPVG